MFQVESNAAKAIQAQVEALESQNPRRRSRWPIGWLSGPFPSYANAPAWEVIGVRVADGLAVATRPAEDLGATLHTNVAPPSRDGVFVQHKDEGPLTRVRELTPEEREAALAAPLLRKEHEQWLSTAVCHQFAELEAARQAALASALGQAVEADPGAAVKAAIDMAIRWGGEPFWSRVMRARTLTTRPSEAEAPRALLLGGLETAVGDGFYWYKVPAEIRAQISEEIWATLEPSFQQAIRERIAAHGIRAWWRSCPVKGRWVEIESSVAPPSWGMTTDELRAGWTGRKAQEPAFVKDEWASRGLVHQLDWPYSEWACDCPVVGRLMPVGENFPSDGEFLVRPGDLQWVVDGRPTEVALLGPQ